MGWSIYIVPPLLVGIGGIAGIWVSQKMGDDIDETYGLAGGLLIGSVIAGTYIKMKVATDTNVGTQGTPERNA